MSRVLREKNLSLLSEQLVKTFDDMYWDWIMGQDTFGFSTVDKTAAILRSAQESWGSGEVIQTRDQTPPFHHIHIFPITYHGQYFEPLQEIYQIKIDIKVLRTKSYRHHDNMTKLKDWGEPRGRKLGHPSKLTRLLVYLVIQGLLPECDGYLKLGYLWQSIVPHGKLFYHPWGISCFKYTPL